MVAPSACSKAMSRIATSPQIYSDARLLPELVRLFLEKSERRVLLHCQSLLAKEDLSADERQRLLRLAAAAQEEIRRLAGAPAVEAA
jgi:hypothetical protein